MNATIRSLAILALATAVLATVAPARAATYYVSNSAGSDAFDGLAGVNDGVHGPWKSLARASTVIYQPGDKLLLKDGDIWDEALTLAGSGTAQNPVTVASYGAGERPYIHRALGEHADCILVDHAAGYCFRGLELGYAAYGIHVVMDQRQVKDYDYYRFEDCFFHDILAPGPLTQGGPRGYALDWDGRGVPRDIGVVNCIGLRTEGFSSNGSKGNVVFNGDTISHGSLNQVFQSRAADFDITNCVFVFNYPWQYNSWGVTQVIAGELKGGPDMRYDVIHNEFGWPGDYPGSPDGCGYDFEVSTNDVTFQDNFVHDSYGEGVLFMGNRVQNNLIFDNNLFRDNVRFSPRWNCTIALPTSVTGSGTFSHNVFYLWSGKSAFGFIGQKAPIPKPTSFTYVDNNEHPTRPFAAMPLVTHIEYRAGERIYTLASATPGATIHYTLDASLPSLSSPVYSQPIVVKRSGVLNAKAFKQGYYPSYVNSLAVELRRPAGSAPVAWWKLDEASGKAAVDSIGGSSGGVDGATWIQGNAGHGLDFNGRSASVSLHSGRLAAVSKDFTVAFWARPAARRAATPEVGSGVGLTGTAWWKMDEGGGDVLTDSAGGASGKLSGCTWTEGKYGSGLLFKGKSDMVTFYGAGLSDISNTFTLSFWADPQAVLVSTPESNTGISGISGQRYALDPRQYSAASGGAGAGVSVGTNGVSVFELADSYLPSLLVYDHALTGWSHIVVVYRDRQPSLYLNGVLVKTGLKSTKTVHPAFQLGGSSYGGYQGKLDDVRVYPRALTDAEIRDLNTMGEVASIPWSLDRLAGTSGLPYALAPVSRGGGPSAGDAGVGVAVGVNGISVCESADNYLPSVLVDTLPLKGWNHVAVVYQGGQPSLYLNGVFEKAGCRSEKNVHPVFNLGGGAGPGWYKGGLSDVRIYDHALTDAEVQELAGDKGNR